MILNEYKYENWKPVSIDIEGFTTPFLISDYGRVKRWNKQKKEWVLYKPMKGNKTNKYSYYRLTDINKKLKTYSISVHRLVALHFLEKPKDPEKKFVTYLDHNHENNYYKNLKWVTRKELNFLNKDNRKKKNIRSNAKLTETKVIRLKMKLKRGKIPYYKLAKEFGISHTQLKRIRRGENWGDVKID